VLDYLINLIGRLGNWAYLLIFLASTLESAAFLGLFVPGESLVLVAGFFAAQGLLDLDVLILTVAVGATIGDSIGYELGRRLGRPGLLRYGSRFGLNQARITEADGFFARHGGKSVFWGRFVGFARVLVPFLAGSSHMPYRRFLPYNALGAILWSSVVVLLGYFLGASWRVAERWVGAASAIIGAVLVFILALAWMWRWAVRHEADIRRWWDVWRQRPRVVALRERFATPIAFVEARLSPQGAMGLSLTIGALVLIGASWLFGAIAEDVLTGDPLTIVDVHVANWLHAHATPGLTRVLLMITRLNGVVAISSFVVVLAIYMTWKRDWHWLLALAIIVPGGMLLNVMMKLAFHRARPQFDDVIVAFTTYSFPSGHVAGATLLYGVLAAYLVTHVSAWRWRVLIVLCAFLAVVLVALSRVYLGAHFLSDVLAAFAEGVAWLALCLIALHTLRQPRARH
jgi:undecaprenyl-diphosphatase